MSEILEADFVIVGAGSAGCALAYRLSEDPRNSVIVLERGGTDAGPLIQMPIAFSIPMNMSRYDWGFKTEPEPHLGGRRLVVPRGKVVGGSSSVNGMVYVRGHARDFDTWEEMGATGWGFRNVLPYYKRMETSHGGEAGWRGTDGPLHVTRGRQQNPLYQAFVEAGREAGYPVTADYNGRQQEGFGAMEMTVWQGRRWSAANAYLKPALKRPNLRLVTGVSAERIAFDGTKATGVVVRKGGTLQTVTARREVIVAASSINSPKLLMLSGVGAAADLTAHGIDVIADRPGVGRNLQDHLEVYVQYGSKQPVTLNNRLGLLSKAWIGANWLFLRRGLGVSNQFESCGFIRTAAGVAYPDIQYHFLPAAVRYDGTAAIDRHGFQVHVGPMRSPSRGSVSLRSGDPADDPKILFNYMSHDKDWADFRACIRLTREIMTQAAMEPFVDGEIAPGADAQSDAAIDDFIRSEVESAYHPCGTCRMGSADDAHAVVDPECRVIGTQNIRVVDSSIFPQITNGNLNGPSILVGEKAADIILGKDPLPASNQEPWINPDWQTSQR